MISAIGGKLNVNVVMIKKEKRHGVVTPDSGQRHRDSVTAKA